ncbi:ubiquitin-like protein SMT3 [Tanacetum coccineum]
MSGGGDEDSKPNTGGDHINLKVKGQDGNEVFFRIKRSTQLKKLMNAYCDRQSVEINSIAFLFDGRRLRAEQTPDELEMEEGDEIDAMLHQTGGGGGEENKKPDTCDEGARIILKVKLLQDGSEVFFRIRRSTQLKKLMIAYCDRKAVELNLIVFLFDGRFLRGEDTAHELKMKEGDEIYAMHRLTGVYALVFEVSMFIGRKPVNI